MNNKDYEQKKRECWEEFRTHVICGTDNPKGWFERAFDRAYARDEVSGMWLSGECPLDVGLNLFPDITWSDEPQEVEIIIKRKKNGNI